MINQYLKADDVREIHFYKDNTEVSASSFFELIYSNLDNLIKYNRHLCEHKKNNLEFETICHKELRSEFVEKALKDIKKSSKSMGANIIFDDNSFLRADIKPRTNFY